MKQLTFEEIIEFYPVRKVMKKEIIKSLTKVQQKETELKRKGVKFHWHYNRAAKAFFLYYEAEV